MDSEISSIASYDESRKSSVEGDGRNHFDCLAVMEGLRGQRVQVYPQYNGGNEGFLAGCNWREEREGLLIEILECKRRVQVRTCV